MHLVPKRQFNSSILVLEYDLLCFLAQLSGSFVSVNNRRLLHAHMLRAGVVYAGVCLSVHKIWKTTDQKLMSLARSVPHVER